MSSRNRSRAGQLTEKEFQQALCQLATLTGWRWIHFRTVRDHRNNYSTPLQGSAGFPDLVLVHPDLGVLFVELKTTKGRLSEHQTDWATDLLLAGAEYYCWRPEDWSTIKTRLGAK